jgi:hypothetical protein
MLLEALRAKTSLVGLTKEQMAMVTAIGAPPTRWQRRHSATAKADRMEARQGGQALNPPRRKTGRQKPVPKPPTKAQEALAHAVSGACTALTKKQTLCQRKAKPGTFFCVVHTGASTTAGA